jgi:DNA processing protein
VRPFEGQAAADYECALGLAWQGLTGTVVLLGRLNEMGVQDVWHASRATLLAWGMSDPAVEVFLEARRGFDESQAMAVMKHGGQGFIPYGSPAYPRELYQLEYPPAGLFWRGRSEVVESLRRIPRMTVVGTRRASAEGLEAARSMTAGLAKRGVGVLSGMALGIDAQAHKAALQEAGTTVAVLGCGADVIYPPRHRWLYGKIIEAGLVLSELPPGARPTKWTFPHRNRLLAALSDAVLVVEGCNTSGALQTARWALELGRPVFSVPGSIFKESCEGCNALIYEGASPALQADVLVEDFLWATRIERGGRGPTNPPRETAGEQLRLDGMAKPEGADNEVLHVLKGGPTSVDDLVSLTGLSVREVSASLGRLEMQGAVTRAGPGMFLRVC